MIASQMLPFIIIGGFLFHMTGLITLGIYCYLVLLVFQLITLPVEFDASRRAKIILQQMGIVQPGEEIAGVNQVLNAAALDLCGGVHRRAREPALVHVRPRSPVISASLHRKMNAAVALPSLIARLSDLLSSAPRRTC